MKHNSITVSIADAPQTILAIWAGGAGLHPCLIGFPGIGKTDIAAEAANLYGQEIGLEVPFFARSMATMSSEDFVVLDRDPSGAILQKPVNAYRVGCERPAVVLNDEINRCQHSVQNAQLGIFQGGVLGDYKLHAGTRLIAAMNDADEEGGDGARELIPALGDRLFFLYVRADWPGFFDYLTNRVGAPGSALRELAIDYGFTADRSRKLVSFEPAPGETKRPSPRAIVHGLRGFASALERKLPANLSKAILAGAIGEDAAGAYLAIRKIREQLPTAEEIESNPTGARLPQNVDIAVAVMGVVGVVGAKNPNAAWTYLGRMDGIPSGAEIKIATGKALIRTSRAPTAPDAVKIRDRMLGQIGLAGAGKTVGLSW